ncbi:MAG: hypothetical protein JW699_07800 [Chitinispirillaceae bacterium]|nr:hypothetical protein [Chitinispirillaceae bacterium]
MLHKDIVAAFSAAAAVALITCEPGAPPDPIDRDYFIGTWYSSDKCVENLMFSDVHAEWQINYRTCIADTIQDPFRYVDSIVYDTVRDSFLIMDFKGWEASDSEIVFFDTVRMPGGAVATTTTTLQIDVWSSFQFYVESAEDSSRTLYVRD